MGLTYVTPEQVARAKGCTTKHVRRMIGRSRGAEDNFTSDWGGQRMRVIKENGKWLIELASLAQREREAIVMLDQEELPL